MSDTTTLTPDNTDAVVIELEKKLKELEKDNQKQRTEIREYKRRIESYEALEADFENLTAYKQAMKELEDIKPKYEEAASQLNKLNRDASLIPILNKLGIVDESALEIALEKLSTVEDDFEAQAKQLASKYPFLAGKTKVALPDTGNTNANKEAEVSDDMKLSAGLAKALNK